MKLSSRSQYAITAMLELALHEKSRPVTLHDISQKQKISLSYLEQLFANLRRHELVRGRRGPGGGYVLARDVKDISIADIVTAVDDIPQKNTAESALTADGISSDLLWNNISHQIYDYLRGINLSQFLQPAQAAAPSADISNDNWKAEVAYHSRA
ncbi:Rrf2 family transcriptional regulator [Sulfuriflexus mobilis]|uniref:Rrf2 family transcriptional regulator n=1 Tax=Sulfuriflexus mobilis TaxID=1811807 RepID=UPI000F83230B|nr:Rrf2 family transcriptional regulator [Sulfuriflexus mobilis]